MMWKNPDLLWLLLFVPVLAGVTILAWRLRERARRRFGVAEALASMVVGRSGRWRATRGVLGVLGVTLLILALAGPQYGSQTRLLRKRGVDVVIVLDFSKSMLARDVRPSRIERAKVELAHLLDELDGDRVGIVAFAGETMEFPMTTDYAAATLFFRDLGPYDMPVGGTSLGRALTAAKRLLDRSSTPGSDPASRSRVALLMTDGEDHEGDPVTAARELAAAHIKVHVVGIGTATGEPIPAYSEDGEWVGYMRDSEDKPVLTALSQENENQLREIARIAGGRYFHAGRGRVGVDEIRAELRRMHQDERKTRRVTVNEERYALVLLPAFLFLLLEGILPEAWIGRRRRRPGPSEEVPA